MSVTFDAEYKTGEFCAKKEMFGPARFFLRSAAEKGNMDAANDLGVVYEKEEEEQKASFWYYVASKEEKSPTAMINFATWMLMHAPEGNADEIIRLYKKATKLNYSFAYFCLGRMYEKGNCVVQDNKKAFECYLKGSKKEDDDLSCLNMVGYCYETGLGVEIDYKKAFEYYKKASDRGSSISKYNLGLCYMYGKAVETNIDTALEHIFKAATLGSVDAMDYISKIYYEGNIVEGNIDVSIFWGREAFKNDNLDSALRLAKIYIAGEKGINKDLSEAHTYLERFVEICPENDKEHWEQYKDLKQYCSNSKFWISLDTKRNEDE